MLQNWFIIASICGLFIGMEPRIECCHGNTNECGVLRSGRKSRTAGCILASVGGVHGSTPETQQGPTAATAGPAPDRAAARPRKEPPDLSN